MLLTGLYKRIQGIWEVVKSIRDGVCCFNDSSLSRPSEPGGGRGACGALFVEMGFYGDISWELRCNIEINVGAHFYKILLVFEVPYQPE